MSDNMNALQTLSDLEEILSTELPGSQQEWATQELLKRLWNEIRHLVIKASALDSIERHFTYHIDCATHKILKIIANTAPLLNISEGAFSFS